MSRQVGGVGVGVSRIESVPYRSGSGGPRPSCSDPRVRRDGDDSLGLHREEERPKTRDQSFPQFGPFRLSLGAVLRSRSVGFTRPQPVGHFSTKVILYVSQGSRAESRQVTGVG